MLVFLFVLLTVVLTDGRARKKLKLKCQGVKVITVDGQRSDVTGGEAPR